MLTLLAVAVVCVGVAYLVDHVLTSRLLALVGTIVGAAVLLVLLDT